MGNRGILEWCIPLLQLPKFGQAKTGRLVEVKMGRVAACSRMDHQLTTRFVERSLLLPGTQIILGREHCSGSRRICGKTFSEDGEFALCLRTVPIVLEVLILAICCRYGLLGISHDRCLG